jgi:hypothetical protein
VLVGARGAIDALAVGIIRVLVEEDTKPFLGLPPFDYLLGSCCFWRVFALLFVMF